MVGALREAEALRRRYGITAEDVAAHEAAHATAYVLGGIRILWADARGAVMPHPEIDDFFRALPHPLARLRCLAFARGIAAGIAADRLRNRAEAPDPRLQPGASDTTDRATVLRIAGDLGIVEAEHEDFLEHMVREATDMLQRDGGEAWMRVTSTLLERGQLDHAQCVARVEGRILEGELGETRVTAADVDKSVMEAARRARRRFTSRRGAGGLQPNVRGGGLPRAWLPRSPV